MTKEGDDVKIIEQFLRGKINDTLCEDTIVANDNFVAIVDGVTSKSDFSYQRKTTGKWASTLVAQVLTECPEETTLPEIISRVNQKFADFYEDVTFTDDIVSQGLQAVSVIYSNHFNELWFIGDCQAYVNGQVRVTPKKSDVVLSQMRSLILTTNFQTTNATPEDYMTGEDPSRTEILPWILKATNFANEAGTDFGYAIFNGTPIPDSLIQVVKLEDNPQEIALASDGYPQIQKDLDTTEVGLADVIQNDPLCYQQFPSTKGLRAGNNSFDDRSYIRFTTEK